jgi:RNA polymerase primary sigma factor
MPKHKSTLSKSETLELIKLAKEGRLDARNKVIEANLGLIGVVAKRYMSHQMPMGDLIQEGVFGLHEAIMRFDASKGVAFSTYAAYWIRCKVREAVLDNGSVVRLPKYAHELLVRYNRTASEMSSVLQRTPGFDEVVDRLGYGPGQRDALMNAIRVVRIACGNQEGSDAIDCAEARSESRRDILVEAAESRVQRLMAALGEREALVIRKRYGLGDTKPRSHGEIGAMLGVSKQRAHQVEAKALSKMGAIR